MISQLPLNEQLDAFQEVLSRNEVLTEVLSRSASLGLPGWYLTAGCLFQTVWNAVTSQAPGDGIKDYDLFYFDATDLSWEAEDAVIQSAKHVFADIPIEVEIRNEARVHLQYEEKFGTPCPAHLSTEDAIGSFAATTCCLGVRLESGGRWRVYAPHGLSDVFNLVPHRCSQLTRAEKFRLAEGRVRNLRPFSPYAHPLSASVTATSSARIPCWHRVPSTRPKPVAGSASGPSLYLSLVTAISHHGVRVGWLPPGVPLQPSFGGVPVGGFVEFGGESSFVMAECGGVAGRCGRRAVPARLSDASLDPAGFPRLEAEPGTGGRHDVHRAARPALNPRRRETP
ncbi:nucleotidyltransferase family protein [Amycolatopsis sp. CA-161197]|uniref:nucleotidyltransferase family protein n=1 Tax=Amycolatopsis sp. CA-161197 TaxID=3239922 RepID=UPI003D916B34